jgi:protein-arginine kinase activator protein McsA
MAGDTMAAYTEEELREAVLRCKTVSEVLRTFNLRITGGNHKTFKKWADFWGISRSHFWTQAEWIKNNPPEPKTLDTILVINSNYGNSGLKNRLFRDNLKERKCEMCGQDENWHGKKMSLILDHINGSSTDNRLENLRMVCPNCNATLDTHCGKASRSCKDCGEKSFKEKLCSHCKENRRILAEQGKTIKESSPLGSKTTRDINWNQKPKPEQRKVPRPSYETLLEDKKALGWAAMGRKYGVSDNAIRKWFKIYEKYGEAANGLTIQPQST